LALIAFPLIGVLSACSPWPDEWTDEVKLHDGRIVRAIRSVAFTRHIALSDGHLYIDSPSLYGLEAINPNTKEEVEWFSKDEGVHPVLLDFDGATTYLVILLPQNSTTNKKYGCPWPPYVFLRHEQDGEWKKISASEAPTFLGNANLSYRYDKQNMNRVLELQYLPWDEQKRVEKLYINRSDGEIVGFQTFEVIAKNHKYDEDRFPDYYFQIAIPRSRAEWKLKYPTPNCRQPI
jgi:hypothetical protein